MTIMRPNVFRNISSEEQKSPIAAGTTSTSRNVKLFTSFFANTSQ